MSVFSIDISILEIYTSGAQYIRRISKYKFVTASQRNN